MLEGHFIYLHKNNALTCRSQ